MKKEIHKKDTNLIATIEKAIIALNPTINSPLDTVLYQRNTQYAIFEPLTSNLISGD
jgi:hypothetical protein